MGALASTAAPRARTATLAGRVDGPAVAAWLLPFAAVLYLALEKGGYDPIVRGQVGVALWWIVLVGAAAGILPAARIGRVGWVGLGLFVGLAVWTAASLGWTESQERTWSELGKVATYAGLFTLTLTIAGRTSSRHALNGLASAIGVVALAAVLSRLQPQLFPGDDLPRFFGETAARRLSYPLNYWNALAAFAAIGLPLLLRGASDARTIAMRAVAAAAVPVVALCVFFTVSRGGAIAVAVSLVAWIVLAPARPAKLATLLVTGAASAIVVAGADQRDALQTGLSGPAASAQGDDLLAMLIIVCLGVAFLQVAIALVARHVERPRWARVSRGRSAIAAGALVLVAAAVAVGAGVPGTVDREWDQFKEIRAAPTAGSGEDAFARLESTSGNGRYQYWQQAAEAQADHPFAGIGAGTFEFWWARTATYTGGFIRDAHSLYMETLAELGIIGFALLLGLLGLAVGTGALRAFGRLPAEHRSSMAAGTAALLTFCASALVEWVWDLPAVAAVAVVLMAVLIGGGRRARARRDRPAAPRAVLALTAVLALVAVAVPLAVATSVRDSERSVRAGDLSRALEHARTATNVQPSSATGALQEALVLERARSYPLAVAAARRSVRHEPTNWRTWLVLSRLEALAGRPQASVAAFRRARSLNPRSSIFTGR
jgi:O-antigen ligase